MPVSLEEMQRACTPNLPAAMAARGITVDALVDALKKELHAKETKLVKIKAIIPSKQPKQDLPISDAENQQSQRGREKALFRTVYEGGVAEDTVIAVDMVNWGVRQAARIDAQKLLGAYPSQKIEISGNLQLGDRIKAARERMEKVNKSVDNSHNG